MQNQNVKNHVRLIPLWHYITSTVVVGSFIGAVWIGIRAYQAASNRLNAAVILGLSVSILLIYWYARVFALKAQDKAIRAEENFRHFIITGKPLDSRITMSQVIALRFAPDEEFVALAARAANEGLKQSEIKKAIVNWKGDYNRV